MKRVGLLICLPGMVTLLFAATTRRQEPVTFSNQVVRILQRNCQVCHHPGDIAPFSLMTYQDARPYAAAIKFKTQNREMPPWKPVPGCGDFEGVRRLDDSDIATITQWVDSGAPEGDEGVLPPPVRFPDVWPLGEPDAVVQPDADFSIPGSGPDIYRCFSIPTALRGERFLSAVEIKPGNRRVVHHVITFLDETGESKQMDEAEPGPGYTCFGGPGFSTTGTLGGWAPGSRSAFEPAGAAWRLPKNARIVIQIHYHPTGQPETDRTQIGLYYAREPVRKELRVLPVINQSFVIPAGDPHYRVTALGLVPPGFAAHAIAIAPHMHLLGREMEVIATYPNGSTKCLMNIDNWDFHWQGVYHYKEAIALPAFTRLDLTAYYDNSENNPENPNSPPRPVRWGEQTTDEMCIAFVEFTLDGESRDLSSPQMSSALIDGDELIVTGRGFVEGSDIEIDGKRLADTNNHKKKTSKKLISSGGWKPLIVPGRQVSITVLNPDGVRSGPLAFTR